MPDVYKSFCDFAGEHHIFAGGDHIIAGVSGGADSMCLLVLLHRLSQDMDFRLTAVHVNHQLRGSESDEDEAFVKEFCRKEQIPCVAVHAAVREYAQQHGFSLEEAGRIARYQTFYQVARKISGTDEIPEHIKAAVAHQREDNAETILLNLARGSGLRGMRGIRPVSSRFGMTVVRPMLGLSRADIEAYLRSEGVPFRTDSSNQEDVYTRNKVRLHIIPQLQEVNSQAARHINEAAASVLEAQDFIECEAGRACGLMVDERGDGRYIDLSRFGRLHAVVKRQMIRDLVEQMAGSLKDISRIHIESVLELENKQTGRRVDLPYGIMAQRSYGNIILRKATADDRLAQNMTDYARNRPAAGQDRESGDYPQGAPMAPGGAELEALVIDPSQLPAEPVRYRLWEGMEISLCLVHVNPVTRQYLIAKNEYTKAFDCAKIKGNLVLRKPGLQEEIRFSGGSKTIRKFFTDEKVPQEERGRVLVLSDEEQIMWIIGYRMSEAYKITEMTNLALQVQIIWNPVSEISEETHE